MQKRLHEKPNFGPIPGSFLSKNLKTRFFPTRSTLSLYATVIRKVPFIDFSQILKNPILALFYPQNLKTKFFKKII